MNDTIDRKFKFIAFNPCNNSIYTEKDSLILCAKDKAVPKALRAYLTECENLECEGTHIASIKLLIERVETYQEEIEARIPDTNGNCEVDRCIGGILD